MTEPTFEEGTFFFIMETATGQPGKGFIVWAVDASTARSVFGTRTGHSLAYIYPELISSLADVKNNYKLTNAQIADLHRDGYLRL